MRRRRVIVVGVVLLFAVVVVRAQLASAGKPNVSGLILNRDQSDKPPQPQSGASPNVSLQLVKSAVAYRAIGVNAMVRCRPTATGAASSMS